LLEGTINDHQQKEKREREREERELEREREREREKEQGEREKERERGGSKITFASIRKSASGRKSAGADAAKEKCNGCPRHGRE
jgi:hypothetical protein